MMSVTQAGNYTALIPLIILILAQFDIKLTQDDALNIIMAFITLAGIVTSIYGRYRQGDVNALGVKKAESDNR